MVKVFIYQEVKASMNNNQNKGYTMLMMLLVLMMMASMCTLILKKDTKIDTDYLSFINNYLNKQSYSLTNYERSELLEENITFNKLGHINGAKTINKGNHDVIVHIGNGYLTYE